MVLLSVPCIGGPDRTAGTPALNVTVQGSIDNGNLGSTFLMNEKQEAREKAIQARAKLPRVDQEISSTRIKEIWNNVKGGYMRRIRLHIGDKVVERFTFDTFEELEKYYLEEILPFDNKSKVIGKTLLVWKKEDK